MSTQKKNTGGRPSSLRTPQPGKRSLGCIKYSLLAVLILPLLLFLTGAAYQGIGIVVDAQRYPPPGELIDVGGYRMHIYCTGNASPGLPTVVLAASHPATSTSWVWIQPEISAVTRTCAYDRSGTGWSDPGRQPASMRQMADELHSLLTAAAEPGPYLLVGHSWGGGVTRLYQTAHPELVSGLVWIEATHPDAWARRGLPESTFGGMNPEMVEGIPIASRIGILRLFPDLRGGWGVVPGLPARQQAELTAYFNTNTWADHVVAVEHALPDTLAQLRNAGSIGDIPLIIIVAEASEEANLIGSELQSELAGLSTNSTIHRIDGADHSSLVHEQQYARQVASVIMQMVNRTLTLER